MVTQVDLRIDNVDTVEISQLKSSMHKLKQARLRERIIKTPHGFTQFILTVKPASVQQIKKVLRVVLRIVTPERIAIET
ncbi:MAG: hypothetical protein ACE5IR_04150 [bacterium]